MRHSPRRLALIALLVVFAGCRSKGSFVADDGTVLSSSTELGGGFVTSLYTSLAERVVECTAQPAAAVSGQLDTESFRARVENSMLKKRVALNEAEANTCLSALEAASCAEINALFAEAKGACDKALVGQVAVGGECFEANECARGSFCSLVSDCTGECVAYTRLGGGCGAGTICEPGTQCLDGLCRERGGLGATCGGQSGQSCNSDHFCSGDSATAAGSCAPPQTEGSCESNFDCQLGFQCAAADDSLTTGACTATKGEGAACNVGRGECAPFTGCTRGDDGAGRCTLYRGVGEQCGVFDGEFLLCLNSWCGLDAGATEPVGTCRERLPDGEPCTDGGQCVSGICDFFSAACVSACPLQ